MVPTYDEIFSRLGDPVFIAAIVTARQDLIKPLDPQYGSPADAFRSGARAWPPPTPTFTRLGVVIFRWSESSSSDFYERRALVVDNGGQFFVRVSRQQIPAGHDYHFESFQPNDFLQHGQRISHFLATL